MAEVTQRDGQAQVLLAQAQLDQARAALDITRKHLRTRPSFRRSGA